MWEGGLGYRDIARNCFPAVSARERVNQSAVKPEAKGTCAQEDETRAPRGFAFQRMIAFNTKTANL